MLSDSEFQRLLNLVYNTRFLSLPSYGKVESVNFKNGDLSNIQTQIDLDIEAFLKNNLAEIFPQISFVGEELGGDRSEDTFFLVDPIDGTANYVRGTVGCTTMISLIHEGQVVLSAIYDFVRNKMYWAQRGSGAYCNGNKLQVSQRTWEHSSLMFETKNESFAQFFMKELRERYAFKYSCAGYEYALVASGKVEGRISVEPYGAIWDYSPGSLLVEEAGGLVFNLHSDQYDYKNLDHIVCNKKIYLNIVESIDTFYNKKLILSE